MSARRLRKLAAAVGFCAAGASVVGTAGALAVPGDDATLVVAHNRIDARKHGGALLDCGPQGRAIGGGAAPSSGSPSTLLATGPLDETGDPIQAGDGDVPRYWWAVIRNDTDAPRDFSFYASCSSNSDATIQVESFVVPPQTLGGGTGSAGAAAACPGGQRAIGGGVVPVNTIHTYGETAGAAGPLDETGLPSNTDDGDIARFWYSAAFNFSGGSKAYRALALCSPGSTATVEMTKIDAGRDHLSAAPTCPIGSRALGGGLVGENSLASLESSFPTDAAGVGGLDTGAVAYGWSSSAFTYGDRLGFSVICQDDPPASPGGVASENLAASAAALTGKRTAALAKCKKKRSKKARKRCRRKARRLPI